MTKKSYSLTLNVPSANQCLHVFNTERLESVVKMIKSFSSWSTKFSPRSVCFRWSGSLLSGSVGMAWLCRRMVRKSVWLLGSWPAESKGKDLITECKMVLEGSSLSAARAFILFLRSTTGARSRFGAWQCSVGPERIASIVGLVWQRPNQEREINRYYYRIWIYLCNLDFDSGKSISHRSSAPTYRCILHSQASPSPSRSRTSE